MPVEYYSQSSWAGGEFSPSVTARDDIDAYAAGAAAMLNFVAYIEGGAAYRAGFMRFAEALTPTQAEIDADEAAVEISRLISFQRSAGRGYVLELGHKVMRIWDPETFDTVKAEDESVYTVEMPYASQELSRLTWYRQGDIMLVFDALGVFPTYVIQHYAADNWVVEAYEYQEGPWANYATDSAGDDVTLTITGAVTVGSTVTLATTADSFDADMIGSLVRIKLADLALPYEKWTAYEGKSDGDDLVAANAVREFNGRIYQNKSGEGEAGNQSPIHAEGTYTDGNLLWEFLHDGAGTVRLTAVTDAQNASAEVTVRLPDVSSTKFWQVQSFNGRDGYPSVGAFYQERLHVSGALETPDTLNSSAISDYSPSGAGFKPGLGSGLITDSDAVTRTLGSRSVDPVVAILPADELYLFTNAGAYIVRGPANEEPITPAGALARHVRGAYGCQVGIQPLLIGDMIIYVEAGGRRLRELSSDGTPGRPSILSEHLFTSGIVDIAWMNTEDRLFILTSDGNLSVCVYDNRQGYSAASPIRLARGALVESMTVVRLSDGTERLWVVTRRTSTTDDLVRSVEVKAKEATAAGIFEGCYLDAAGYFDADDPTSVVDEDGTGTPSTSAGGDAIDPPAAASEPEPEPTEDVEPAPATTPPPYYGPNGQQTFPEP